MKAMLGQRAFRTLWIAQFVSIFGDFIALFGVISLIIFRLHGTAVDVTSVIIAYILPPALLGPFSGVLVDRWNVKRVMIASDPVRGLLAAALVFVVDVRQIGLILAALSVVSSFFGPAQSVALRALVAPQDLLAANALMAQGFYVVRLLSPALAGALVSWLTEKACFWLDAGSFLFSAAMLATLLIARPPARRREGSLKAFVADLAEGNRFIFSHRGLSFAFLAIGAAMFVFSSFSPLISIYIRDTLHAGTMVYGAISSMIGRVSSTFMSLFSFSQVLGLLLSGLLAERLGIRQLFLAAAGALVLLTLIGWTTLRPRAEDAAA